MVRADVRPINRNTDMFSANAAAALDRKMEGLRLSPVSASNALASKATQGMLRNAKEHGAM